MTIKKQVDFMWNDSYTNSLWSTEQRKQRTHDPGQSYTANLEKSGTLWSVVLGDHIHDVDSATSRLEDDPLLDQTDQLWDQRDHRHVMGKLFGVRIFQSEQKHLH
ncbi:MAG: hypothetical protein GY696_21555 [Gammaproteobacteria bacterium]|nr:hypothetical protein [Gammaproteobacteria bacterium]